MFYSMNKFSAKIMKIGINPYVLVPVAVLKKIFAEAGKEKGHIPVKLIINHKEFVQHLVKYSSKWRLYLNTPMRKAASKDVGDVIDIQIAFDPSKREVPMNEKLEMALADNKAAKNVFDAFPPFRQKEIVRYINSLKTEEAVERNIKRAVNFLLGKESFVGRNHPSRS